MKPGPKKKAPGKLAKRRSIAIRDEDWRYVESRAIEEGTSASGYIVKLIRRDRDAETDEREPAPVAGRN